MENSIEQLVRQVCQVTGRESVEIRHVPLLPRIGQRLSTNHDVQKPWLIAYDDDTTFFVDWQKGKASDVLGYSSVGNLKTYAQLYSSELLLKTIITSLLAEKREIVGCVSSFFLEMAENVDEAAHGKLVKMVEEKSLTIISNCAVIAMYQLWARRALSVACDWAQGGLHGMRKGEIKTECFLCRAIYEELSETIAPHHINGVTAPPVPFAQQGLV